MKHRILAMFLLIAALAILSAPPKANAAPAAPPAIPASGQPPADPRRQLEEILQRPQYQRWRLRQERISDENSGIASRIRDIIDSIRDTLRDWFDRLFRGSPRAVRTGGGLGGGLQTFFWGIAWIAVALFVVAIVILIVRLVRSNRAAHVQGKVWNREQVAAALKQGDALALDSSQWLDEAARLAAEKHFRAMYRALYLALLSGLHTRGKIDFNRHHTNWTYVQRFRGAEGDRERFGRLTDLFDNVWYGLTGGEGHDLSALSREVAQLVAPTPPAQIAKEPPNAGGRSQ